MVKNFLIDFDSTLAATDKALLAGVNKEFGTSYKESDLTTWNTEEVMPPEHVKYMWGTLFVDPEFMYTVQPVEGAIQGIRNLWDQGHKCTVVSDRPSHLYDSVEWWLEKYFGALHLIFTRNLTNKSVLSDAKMMTKSQVAYLYKLNWVVEDAPHNSVRLADRQFVEGVYLIDKPYNQEVEHEKITRVHSWNEIEAA